MTTYNHNTLNKFGVSVDGNISATKFQHLKTRYRARFIGLSLTEDGEDLTVNMQKFDTPKGNFATQKVDLVNGEIKYPGKWTWSDLNFTVFNTYDNSTYKALFNQIQRQRDIYEQTTGDAPSNYKFTSIFEHVDGHQNTLSYWYIEGCFLMKAETQGGENGSHDFMTIDCTMSFDNATLYDKDGLQIPSSKAGSVSDFADALIF